MRPRFLLLLPLACGVVLRLTLVLVHYSQLLRPSHVHGCTRVSLCISCALLLAPRAESRPAFRLLWPTKDMNVAVAGVPKTIDNDVDIIDRSFGFLTSVEVWHSTVILSAYQWT